MFAWQPDSTYVRHPPYFEGMSREPGTVEDARARRLVFDKYQPGYGGDLTDWRARALPVAVDLGDQS